MAEEKRAVRRLDRGFFRRDALEVARDLVGKLIIRTPTDGPPVCLRITETEAYRGTEDTACHAHRGRTARTELLWRRAGTIYIYLCYGIHWLLNIISGEEEEPQGVLIRACLGAPGPGRLTKRLGLDGTLNGEDVCAASELGIFDDGLRPAVVPKKRVGIGYAAPEDQARLWRFTMETDERGE